MSVGSLNCGNYEIYIAERGGTPLVCRIKGSEKISFNRTLNEFSAATVEVVADQSCRDCLAAVNPWQHELLIFRGNVLVWCGPIMTLRYRPATSRVQIYARDLLAWTEKRLVELVDEDYDVEDVDIQEVFEWLLEHAYNKDPWGMSWDIQPTGVPITKFYPGYYPPADRWGGLYPVVASEMRSLAQAGIDYTVVNRDLIAGDLEVKPPSDKTLKISDKNWAKLPEIQVSGTQMSTRTIVAGGFGGFYGWYDDQIWIEESSHPWGLLESMTERTDLDQSYTTEHPNAITQEAYARHELLKQPLIYITEGQLAGDAPFEFNELIPGIKMSVGLLNAVRDIETDYRLFSVNTTVDAKTEQISITVTLPGVEGLKEV